MDGATPACYLVPRKLLPPLKSGLPPGQALDFHCRHHHPCPGCRCKRPSISPAWSQYPAVVAAKSLYMWHVLSTDRWRCFWFIRILQLPVEADQGWRSKVSRDGSRCWFAGTPLGSGTSSLSDPRWRNSHKSIDSWSIGKDCVDRVADSTDSAPARGTWSRRRCASCIFICRCRSRLVKLFSQDYVFLFL